MNNKETFCILPFVHLYTQPNGEVKPCCIAGGFDDKQFMREKSIEEIFNSGEYKQLRHDMLSGKRNKACEVCYKKEDIGESSPRQMFNSNTLWTMPEVNEDYSVPSQFQHIDIRFSNLCNFKCRMCNYSFSSNWYDDTVKLRKLHVHNEHLSHIVNKKAKVMKASSTLVADLKPHLNHLKSVYFAGGEPLIMPEHYELLKFLYDTLEVRQDTGKRRLSIHYNTNLSVIKYDEQSLINLWEGFERVFLSISCDGVGKVGEYQRVGFSHERFVENLNTIKKYFTSGGTHEVANGMMYNFQYTTTIWNAYHIFDFVNFMLDNQYITSSDQIDFYYAWTPLTVSINNLTQSEKNRLVKFLETGIFNTNLTPKTVSEIQKIITYIQTPNSGDIKDLLIYTRVLDEFNNTDVMTLNGVNFNDMLQETYG